MTAANYYCKLTMKLATVGERLELRWFNSIFDDPRNNYIYCFFKDLDGRFVKVPEGTVLGRWFRNYTVNLLLIPYVNSGDSYLLDFKRGNRTYDVSDFVSSSEFTVISIPND